MDVERIGDGSWHFRLGVIERWVVTAGAAVLAGVCAWVVVEFRDQLKSQQATLGALLTAQAVANQQLGQLSRQLEQVPGIVQGMAEVKVRVDEHERRIHELEQVRRLR